MYAIHHLTASIDDRALGLWAIDLLAYVQMARGLMDQVAPVALRSSHQTSGLAGSKLLARPIKTATMTDLILQ